MEEGKPSRSKKCLHIMGGILLLTIITIFGLVGCATKHVELPELYQSTYSYEPESGAEGAGIAIALLEPQFGFEEVDDRDRNFQAALQRSMLAYFTSQGFTVSGPFRSMEEMTFPEKKQADLVLDTTLAYSGNFPEIHKEGHTEIMFGTTSYSYWVSGECSYAGTISFTIWEPLSKQRMWTREVPVPRDSVDCSVKETRSGDLVNRIWGNAFTRLYEAMYRETMVQAERYFHPEEVKLIKQQSQELRERTVYGQ